MSDDDVVVLVPLLTRVDRFPTMWQSLRDTTDGVRVLFLCTPGDAPAAAVRAAGGEVVEVAYRPCGDYARKINAGLASTTEPLLFLGADDLVFHPGWLQAIRTTMARCPDAAVIGTQDLGNPRVIAGEHATHSMVTRDYAITRGTIDQPGLILHEGYEHEYVDDEFVETARVRGMWAFAHRAVVEHRHPNWGKAPMDSLYMGQQRRMRAGRAHYQRRRALWT